MEKPHPLTRILPPDGDALVRRIVLAEVLGPPMWIRPALRQPPRKNAHGEDVRPSPPTR